jgi:hypothetical protein
LLAGRMLSNAWDSRMRWHPVTPAMLHGEGHDVWEMMVENIP